MATEEMSLGGVHVTFAPMVDLVRDPRWGRCMETTGEDIYLNCEMARAMVRGFQKSGKVAACVKHFAAYGQAEAGRDYNTTDISERTLRDFYLPAYKAAIDEGAEMVMTSFNALNGVPSSGNKWLVKDILRDEWAFDGIVSTDWHTHSEHYKEVNAGCDIRMPSGFPQRLMLALENGAITRQQLEHCGKRVLKLLLRFA
jgi:beta-glucosidase